MHFTLRSAILLTSVGCAWAQSVDPTLTFGTSPTSISSSRSRESAESGLSPEAPGREEPSLSEEPSRSREGSLPPSETTEPGGPTEPRESLEPGLREPSSTEGPNGIGNATESGELPITSEPSGLEEPTRGQEPAGLEEPTRTREPSGVEEPTITVEPSGPEGPTGNRETAGLEEPSRTRESAGLREASATGEPSGLREPLGNGESTGNGEPTGNGELTGNRESVGSNESPISPTGSPESAGGQRVVHVIQVSDPQGSLSFIPSSVNAQPGDLVQWQFYPGNHSVVLSSFDRPCRPATNDPNAFFSGFVPVDNPEDGGKLTYTIEVKDTQPLWYYCSQSQHCSEGMVGVINPPNNRQQTLTRFAASAKNVQNSVTPSSANQGGITDGTSTNPESPSGTRGIGAQATRNAAAGSGFARRGRALLGAMCALAMAFVML